MAHYDNQYNNIHIWYVTIYICGTAMSMGEVLQRVTFVL